MDAAGLESLRVRWRQTLNSIGESATADAAFDELKVGYSEPGRHYHTLDHVVSVLDVLDWFGKPAPVEALAAWYHDAVYDTRAADNEERSADLARAKLSWLGIPATEIEETARLVLLTKHHRTGASDASGQRLLDADLSVLGSDPDTYERYSAAIRQEYAWVPEAAYREGRRRVLEDFLARQQLYYLLKQAEAPARRNLRHEIGLLGVK